jgi:DNA-directed RNA polymerase alpha subunit
MENLVITSINVEDLIERISTRVYEKMMNISTSQPVSDEDEEYQRMVNLLNTPLDKFNLRPLTINHLKKCNRDKDHTTNQYDTLGNLASLRESDVKKMMYIGKKGIKELKEVLEKNGLEFDMNLSRYQIKPPRLKDMWGNVIRY